MGHQLPTDAGVVRARPVGVEEELLVVDADTGMPLGVAAAVIGRARADGAAVEGELQRQQVEIATQARQCMDDIAQDLHRRRAAAGRAAAEVGVAVAALATSPHAVDPQVADDARYRRMVARFGLLAREQLTCGCHVHVEVAGDEEGVAVIDGIRPWLPVLRAISANSPYWQGTDSGFAGYRQQVWGRWPTSGPTQIFGNAAAYHRAVADVLNTGTVLDEGMIYFDARLSAKLPTVEVRVADVCLHAADAVVLAALTRALVNTAARDRAAGRPPDPVRLEVLELAHWQAARHGLDADLLDPRTHRPAPAWSVIEELLGHVQDALTATGDTELVHAGLQRLRQRGNGARWQRTTSGPELDAARVVRAAVAITTGAEPEQG